MIFLDTNVAIDLRDGQPAALAAVADLPGRASLSVITRIELESGVLRDSRLVLQRRETLQNLLAQFPVVELTEDDILTYGRIVEKAGFDRRRILDRLIAAQALNRSAQLLTRNPRDFDEIEGLNLVAW